MAHRMLGCVLALALVGGAWGEASASLRGPKSPARQLQAQVDSTLCSANPGCANLEGSCCPAANGMNLACCTQELGADATPPAQAPAPPAAPPTVAPQEDNSWWLAAQPASAKNTSCLMEHKFGCNVIKHQLTCLGSRDARNVTATQEGLLIKGQPCVWCGGGPCHSDSGSLCEPLDYLMRGEGKAFGTFYAKPTYQVASCSDGAPVPPKSVFRTPPLPTLPPVPTLAPWWLPDRPSDETVQCLKPATSGCMAVETMGQCLRSKDASGEATQQGLKIAGEPCVWCDGGACFSNSSAKCAPFDYTLRGEGTAFSLFLAKSNFKVASCIDHSRVFKLPGSDFDCLTDVEEGCHTLNDATSCLSSRDGQDHQHKDGFKVHGQPCVWCGGLSCTNTGWTKCEPFDWVLNGQGHAFDVFHSGPVFRVAGCKNGRAAAISLNDYPDVNPGYMYNPLHKRPLVPFWVAKKDEPEKRSCLKSSEGGCNQLRDMASCMTSKDGRTLASIHDLKIAGEPCVWCGGVPCTTNSTSLCEPFDYVMYGEGVAFGDFSAKGVYKVATCDKGDILLPKYDYGCLKPSGPGCDSIWNAEECLASKDGRQVTSVGSLRVHDQPCVWCGGGACHSGKTSLCEAFDYTVNGEGSAFETFHASDSYRLAACKDGKPQAATLSNFSDWVPGYTSKPLPVPTVPPRVQWWVPPRPTEESISGLTYQATGCSAIKDMGTCLSSRDGRTMPSTADGLKIQGEPCVWCGGGACHSNSTTYCEPFDYLMHGEGKAFGLFYAPLSFSVANCKAGIPVPEFDFSCLSSASKGCSALTSAGACLQSKDGRSNTTISGLKVHDQPCLWCGGVACHSGGPYMCEPFDFAMNGEGKAFTTFHAKLSYTFAGCKNNRPAALSYDGFSPSVPGLLPPALDSPHALVPFWVPEHPKEENLTCLAQAMSGCQAIKDMKVCLSSRDESGVQNVKGLKIQGEPCVWCESGACTTNSTAQCQPFDYAMHGEGLAFTTFLNKGTFRVANCNAPVEKPKYEYGCLKETPKGCSALTNPYDCLGSKDGRPQPRIDGLKAFGEPCVWCGGGLCHSGANTMCEPFDYVMNGAGRAFYNFHAKLTYRMAACQNGHPQGATLDGFDKFIPGALPTMKPYWWINKPKPEGDEVSCLMDHKFGCHVIKSKETCLGSKDGRAITQWQGLKIHGEPCVWCGGFPCQSNSTNLCEPYDFLMHGEGKVFLNFNAKTSYNVARCKNNVPLQPTEPESNTPLQPTEPESNTPLQPTEPESPGGDKSIVVVPNVPGSPESPPGGDKSIVVVPNVPGSPESPEPSDDGDLGLSADVDGGAATPAPPMSTAAPVPASETIAPATLPPVTTLAPVTLPPVVTVAPASTVAPATVAPPASTAAPPSGTTLAPATLPPVSTIAPVTLPPVVTIAPLTLPPVVTVAPLTLPPVVTIAPLTLPPVVTIAPLTLPPVVTIAPASTDAPTTLPPAVSTSASATDGSEQVDSSTTASASTAPVTLAPTLSPGLASDDCWYKCGEKAGDCPSFCGEGMVCCRSSFSDSPECSGLSLTAFSTIIHHQCVKKPVDSTVGDSSTGAPGVLVSTSQPGFSIRTSAPAGPVHSDSNPYVQDRNATDNATNTTVVAGSDSGPSGLPAWAWICLFLLGVGILVAAYICCTSGKKGSKKSKKKSKRSAREIAEANNEDSFVSRSSELEMQTPLVQAQERAGQADIFDLIDENHDGVISQAEFNHAMGLPAQAPLVMTQRPSVVMVPGAMPVAMPVAMPAAGQPPMMLVPMPGVMPQPNMPYTNSVQYAQPGARPFGR